MANTNYRKSLAEIAQQRVKIENRTKTVNAEHSKHTKKVKAIQQDLDFLKSEFPKAKADMLKIYSQCEAVLNPLADKDDELAALKKKKPVDKDAVKKLEKEISVLVKKLPALRNQWNANTLYHDELVTSLFTQFGFLDQHTGR
ncbi:MAG: hypothetical protein AAGG09_11405 [Pseudomonadota bacterium]